MFEEMRAAGLNDPVYRQTSGSVHLTLLAELVDRELEARLPEHTRAITAALREANRLSTGDIAEAIGASRPVAQRVNGECTAIDYRSPLADSNRRLLPYHERAPVGACGPFAGLSR
jgi:hypothetical protein